MLNLNDTYILLMLVKEIERASSFLRDRYFPTNEATDIFSTEKVLAEYKAGKQRLAPFVSPRKGGITILRSGSSMKEFQPPNISLSIPLTIDELKRRGFGEAILSNMLPEQRENALVMQDMETLDKMITRREEWMAAQILQENLCVMRHYADKGDEYEEMEVRFFDGASNPSVYVPAIMWDQTGAKIMSDIAQMCRMLKRRGLPATDVLVGAQVADVIQNDPEILKKLDIANLNVGGVDPQELSDEATKIARLNCGGHMVDIISYEAQYESDAGVMEYYVKPTGVVVTAPGAGRAAYGAVTQMEQADMEFHTHTGRRIPKNFADTKAETKELYLKSRPLLLPNNLDPWISAEVM